MVRTAIRYQDRRGRDHRKPEQAACSDLAEALASRIVLSAGMAEQIASVIVRDMGSFLPIMLDLQAHESAHKEIDEMALYSFTAKDGGKVTLVEARSKERASQLIAAQSHTIGEGTVDGAEAASLMQDGAEFIKDAPADGSNAPAAAGEEAQD